MPNPIPPPPWWRRLLDKARCAAAPGRASQGAAPLGGSETRAAVQRGGFACVRLGPRWRKVLRRAWSVRLFAASVACQVLDVLLSTAGAFSGQYRASLALQLAGVAFAALGLWARLVYQQGLSDG